MTAKEEVVRAAQALPEDAMERLFLPAKVERGLQEANADYLDAIARSK